MNLLIGFSIDHILVTGALQSCTVHTTPGIVIKKITAAGTRILIH
jgi:hypothetical protein